MTEVPATIGRYHVARLIAHGGMGSVYLARDPAIDRLVAIKLLREGFEDDAMRERFAREARATGRLRHPNIVTVFDIGEHETRPFIAMEYVPGETLAQLIRRRARVSIVEKLDILEDLCAALHYAHGAGIVHRDIKPANIMLEDVSGTLKILDFGIARAGESGLTNAGEMVGTLIYMSPEQIGGDHVDHRTDVYAVGALAYELLSYQRAFSGTIQDGVLIRILQSGPDPLATLVPGIDPALAPIVEAAMARDPAERYQDMEQLRQDLADVRRQLIERGEGGEVPEVLIDGDAETTVGPSDGPVIAHSPTPTPGGTSREHALPGSRGSSSIKRGTGPLSARARVPASGVGSRAGARVEVLPDAAHAAARRGRILTLGAIGSALLVVLAVVSFGMGWGLPGLRPHTPPAQPLPQQAAPTPAPAPPTPAVPAPGHAAADGRVRDDQLPSVRATARRQIAAGQRQQALDTLAAGLVLDARDPELRTLIAEMARGSKQEASQARAQASGRGSTEETSADFRDARAREREADQMDRSGDRAPAIRAFWSAVGLYERAGRERAQSQPAQPAPVPAPRTEEAVTPPRPDREPPVPPPAAPVAAATDTPLPVPPPLLKPDPPAAPPTDVVKDTRSVDIAAISETLRRYADAYRSRNSAAVSAVMPSLSPQQVRALDRDFSNLRTYSVEIRDQRLVVEGATATVTGQVVRSFVTRSGVAGGNTVATVFGLRKSGGVWTIERVESR